MDPNVYDTLSDPPRTKLVAKARCWVRICSSVASPLGRYNWSRTRLAKPPTFSDKPREMRSEAFALTPMWLFDMSLRYCDQLADTSMLPQGWRVLPAMMACCSG